jgi:putative ABC transport system permease protein
MGIPLVRGRVFEDRDSGSTSHPVIINEGFARRFWSNSDPIGRRFKVGPRDRASWLTIIGVVGDVHQIALDAPAPFSTYEPIGSNAHTRFDVAVRSTGGPANVMGSVRAELRKLEPALLIDKTQTMSERIDDSVSPRRLNLLLFELFAGLSLFLAAVGLYAVVAFAAGQRSHEFGIRLALGAQGRDVLRLVMAQGLRLAPVGTALGIVVTLGVMRFMTACCLTCNRPIRRRLSLLLGYLPLLRWRRAGCLLIARRASLLLRHFGLNDLTQRFSMKIRCNLASTKGVLLCRTYLTKVCLRLCWIPGTGAMLFS